MKGRRGATLPAHDPLTRNELMPKIIDHRGLRYGRLVVLERAENNAWGAAQWSCLCDCGGISVVRGNDLKLGKTRAQDLERGEAALLQPQQQELEGLGRPGHHSV
jgi:hypothetical protein